jgi:predicted phage terminase large subunit-like protein
MGRFIEFDGQKIDVDRQLWEIEKAECEESLVEFIKRAWHVIEPGAPYIHSWHVDLIALHLEAITDRVELDNGSLYNRLLINVPPGTMKSLITNVFWPSWEWGPKNMPHLRYVCAAHKIENLSARDSRRMRQLITSDWYQERWGDRVRLARDQNEKLNFVNSASGFRIATAITSLTGIRGDRVIIDDPHSVDSASSEAMRETEVTTFLEAIPTRLTSPIESAIVVIMQRLHEADVSGAILDKRLGYDHIMLPMRFDPIRAQPTMLGIEDPRQEEGELLFPARFPLEVVDRDERSMGPYATAGQHQQEPAPRGGEVIKAAWWETWMEEGYPPFDYILASLDTAYTTKQENDFSAFTVWGVFSSDYSSMRAENFVNARGKFKNNSDEAARFDEGVRIRDMLEYNPESVPRVMLMGAWQEKLELSALVEKVAKSCRKMKVDRLLIEGKASGLSVAQEIRRLHGNEDWGVQIINPKNLDKLARVYSVQHLFSEGMIYAPDRSWADLVIRQCEIFPKGKNDDLVDTVSQALRYLRETGLLVRAPERMAEIDAGRRHVGSAPTPLYPI